MRVRPDEIRDKALPLLLCVAFGVAWGADAGLLLAAIAFAAADLRVRRGLFAGLILLLPAGLGSVASGAAAGRTIAGTVAVLGSGLTLLRRRPIPPSPLRTVANLLLLNIGAALLVLEAAEETGAIAALIAALAMGATVLWTAGVRGAGGRVSTLVLTLALVLPVVTVVRSLVPDLFLQLAARQAPSDLFRTAASMFGLRTSSSGLLRVSVAVLVLLIVSAIVVSAARQAAAPVRAGTLAILSIAVLQVLVVRAQGGFDSATVADRAAHLVPVVLVALVLLVASGPRTQGIPRAMAVSGGIHLILGAVLAVTHSLALLAHRLAGPSADLTGSASLGLWLVGSLAGVFLAPAAARMLLGAGMGEMR